jgi:radical SAM superfamily enzyme YgiQ (UPF0313 family)
VIQKDVNAEAFNELLTAKTLEKSRRTVSRKLRELDGRRTLSYREQKKYRKLAEAALFAPFVSRNVEKAKAILHDKEDFYNIDKHTWSRDVISRSLDVISTAHYPSQLSLHHYEMDYSPYSTEQLLQAVEDREENIFLEYFEQYTIPEIAKEKPGLVGISVATFHQIIPGLTLAGLAKEAGFYVAVGGTHFTKLVEELQGARELFSCADAFIAYEGEHALLSLAQQLETDGDLGQVPNLIYMGGNKVRINEPFCVEDVNTLPTPDFDGMPFDLYLAPEKVLPLAYSKGCYWKKCAFCEIFYSNIIKGRPGHYRPKKTELVIEDIRQLSQKYGTRFFLFTDETLSPKAMRELSLALVEDNLNIQWLGYARFEEALTPELCQLISRAGCRKLLLGLESGCQRVLYLMEKGINKEQAEAILRNLHEAGVSVYLFCIVGFPTETREEALETLDFLLRNREMIDSPGFYLDLVLFNLDKHCKVSQLPEQYSVSQIYGNDYDDLSVSTLRFQSGEGMDRLEAEQVLSGIRGQTETAFSSRRFPVPEEYNLLYHYHYDKVPLTASPSQPSRDDVDLSLAIPYISESATAMTFRYNLEQIIKTVSEKDGEIEKLNLEKGWLSKEEAGEGIEKEMPFVPREEAHAVLNAETSRMLFIDFRGNFLLGLCDGKRTFLEIARRFAQVYRLDSDRAANQCVNFFEYMMKEGIVGYRQPPN